MSRLERENVDVQGAATEILKVREKEQDPRKFTSRVLYGSYKAKKLLFPVSGVHEGAC